MLLGFFDAEGVVHHEYLPEGTTVDQTYYIEVLKRVRDAIRRKRPEMWRSGDLFLHHDNAPAHSALKTREFLAKHSITVLPHPPYSPDLAPCDFWLKDYIKRNLDDHEDIKSHRLAVTRLLREIPEEECRKTFEKLLERMQFCIDNNGEYFEHLM